MTAIIAYRMRYQYNARHHQPDGWRDQAGLWLMVVIGIVLMIAGGLFA